MSRADSVFMDILYVDVCQIELKAASPSSRAFLRLALPFAWIDRFNAILLMFPDSIAVLKMPTKNWNDRELHI